ncbi:hypothetical protein, partial [Vibrio hannami]
PVRVGDYVIKTKVGEYILTAEQFIKHYESSSGDFMHWTHADGEFYASLVLGHVDTSLFADELVTELLRQGYREELNSAVELPDCSQVIHGYAHCEGMDMTRPDFTTEGGWTISENPENGIPVTAFMGEHWL